MVDDASTAGVRRDASVASCVGDASIISWFDMPMVRDRTAALLFDRRRRLAGAAPLVRRRGRPPPRLRLQAADDDAASWRSRVAREARGSVGAAVRPGAILAGLACSLGGRRVPDAPGRLVPPGAGGFLCAHVCYIGAFLSRAGAARRPRRLPFAFAYVVARGTPRPARRAAARPRCPSTARC